MIEGSCHCGKVLWRFDGVPESATACNCTVCRRYGVLWAYDYVDEAIHVTGETRAYIRGEAIQFHFCPACGCVICWRGQMPKPDGRVRTAVNLRLAEPDAVAEIPVEHFDGLTTFQDLGQDGRRVKDLWF
jgi:hypothetical protein